MITNKNEASRIWRKSMYAMPAWVGDPAWLCLQSEFRQERLAEQALRETGFTTFLPEYSCRVKRSNRVAHTRRGKEAQTVRRLLFPGYLFIQTVVADKPWRIVHTLKGVRAIMFMGEWPARVPDEVIDKIRGAENCGIAEEAPSVPFTVGQTVRVEDGPFAGFDALVEQIRAGTVDEEAAVMCLLELFGRKVRIRVSASQLGRP